MLEPAKRVMGEFCILVVKMDMDGTTINSTKVNSKLLNDIEILYALAILLPLFEQVDNLMKLAQVQDVFVVDYVATIQLCKGDLFSNYVDYNTTYKYDVFYAFKSLVDSSHEILIMRWITNVNTCMEHLTLDCSGQHIYAKHLNQLTSVVRFVTREVHI